MGGMVNYMGFKAITATPMNRKEYNDVRGWTVPPDEDPRDEGSLVCYGGDKNNCKGYDGYVSWSPKAQFEDAYKSSGEMSFSMALEALKQGKKVARRGWNGKGMFLYFTSGSMVPVIHLKEETASHLVGTRLCECDECVTFNGHIDMKTGDGSITIGWVPTQVDMFSNDWEIVE